MDEYDLANEIEYTQSRIDACNHYKNVLPAIIPVIDHNISKLKELSESLKDSIKFSDIVKEHCKKGEENFIKGACYCGQDVGKSEEFADIATDIDKSDEEVAKLIPIVDDMIPKYIALKNEINSMINRYSLEVAQCQTKIANLQVQKNMVTARLDNNDVDEASYKAEKLLANVSIPTTNNNQPTVNINNNLNSTSQKAALTWANDFQQAANSKNSNNSGQRAGTTWVGQLQNFLDTDKNNNPKTQRAGLNSSLLK